MGASTLHGMSDALFLPILCTLLPCSQIDHQPLAIVMVSSATTSFLLLAILTSAFGKAPDRGPAVGTFKLAPALSVYGAYHNESMNSWGGAIVHVPEDKATPYHMFVE